MEWGMMVVWSIMVKQLYNRSLLISSTLVKRSGNKERWPTVDRSKKFLKISWFTRWNKIGLSSDTKSHQMSVLAEKFYFVYLASLLLTHPNNVIGKMTKRMAFSWTCQPNKNEVQPQRQRHLINCCMLLGLNQSLTSAGNHITEICQNIEICSHSQKLKIQTITSINVYLCAAYMENTHINECHCILGKLLSKKFKISHFKI